MTLPKFNVVSILKDASRAFQFTAMARQAASLLVSIILVKGALSQSEVGLYEEWFYLGAILTFLLVSGLVQAFVASYTEAQGPAQIFQAYWILMTGLASISLIIYIFSGTLVPFLCGVSEIPHLGKVLCFLILHFGAALVPYYLLVLRKSEALLIFGTLYLGFMVLAVLIGISQGRGLDSILLALLVFAVIEHGYLVYLLIRKGAIRFKKSVAKALGQRALPLAGYSFVGALGLLFDAWLVNHHFADLSVFAIFRYGARELPGALALAGAFSAAMLPLLKTGSTSGVKLAGVTRLHDGSLRLMHLFMPISIVLMLLSPWLFAQIYNDAFVPSAEIFNVYLLLMIARWIFAHTVLISRREEKLLFIISLIELALNIALSIWWLSLFGLVGIAYATVVAYLFEKFVLMVFLRKRHLIHPGTYFHLGWWSFYSLILITSFFITGYLIHPS